MSCLQTIQDYALRSIGMGERLLPRADITLCEQFTLIGSGMIWNVYYGVLALSLGFFLAVLIAVGKTVDNPVLRGASNGFVMVFRSSPLFIQFFFGYLLFLELKQIYPMLQPLTAAAIGALIVLFLNTAAYTAEIFYGALKSIPRGDIEAADAYGMSGFSKFRRIVFPTMLRLAWPSYTNEAIFLLHGTTLVFFSGFPVRGQRGDALYYASYFADKTFNPFVPYPIMAMYYVILVLIVIAIMGRIGRRLSAHVPSNQ